MMIEAGVVAAYVIAWAVRKARRVAGRVDAEVDAAIDAGLDKLHTAVTAKLGAHPVLDDLAEEAATDEGRVSELTRLQVELAITAAAKKDDGFGREVTDLVAQLRGVEQERGVSVVAGAGDVHVHRDGAGGQMSDPSEPGRSRP